MDFNRTGYCKNFNNYLINSNLLKNNLLIRIWEYIRSELYFTKNCINELECYGSKNRKYFSEISSDNVISIKKALTNICNVLRNSSLRKELRIFNTIKDMYFYILENNIASENVFSFLKSALDLFEELADYSLNENSSRDDGDWKLFKLEEEFYEKYYEPTHEFDDLIVDITRIILGCYSC